jgi:hypothetical protein
LGPKKSWRGFKWLYFSSGAMPLLTLRDLPFDGFSEWVGDDNLALLLTSSDFGIGVADDDGRLDPVSLPLVLLEA